MAAVEILRSESPLDERGAHLSLVVAPAPESAARRVATPVGLRRAARSRMLARRRRALACAALVGALTFLAWPGHALGGVNAAGMPTDLATFSSLAPGTLYVVQSGDSVSSIAALMNPLDPRTARAALVAELGSAVVVPGEHVVIP
jgi:hypothetical protein